MAHPGDDDTCQKWFHSGPLDKALWSTHGVDGCARKYWFENWSPGPNDKYEPSERPALTSNRHCLKLMSLFCVQRVSSLGVAPAFFLKKSLSMFSRKPPKRDPSFRITPSPIETIQSPNDLLKAIGRKSETKISVESWSEFWKMGGRAMRKAGVPVKDRRHDTSRLTCC